MVGSPRRRFAPAGRVARGGCPPPAPTEPDLWASHPALRSVGVRFPVARRWCCHPQLSQVQRHLDRFWGDDSGPTIVIAGRPLPFVLSVFGTARVRGRGRPRSLSPSAPFGLSAVAEISSSCLSSSLAVTAFPPPEPSLQVSNAFRRPCGSSRSSDSSRPFVIRPFVLLDYRSSN